MQTLVEIAGFCLLLAIGCGVFLTHRNTAFLASVVQENLEGAAQAAQPHLYEYEEEQIDMPGPIGFHSPNKGK